MKEINNKTGHFPTLEDFYHRFRLALETSGKETQFLDKWGLETPEDIYPLLAHNIQGGYDSHHHCMTALPPGESVLDIGPGMGFCAFLLAEIYPHVLVAEPDNENCNLLTTILQHYHIQTNTPQNTRPASETTTLLHAGISITPEAVKYWQAKREILKRRNIKGSILNFDIQSAAPLSNTVTQPVSRIYLHKVLSSFSIAGSFDEIIHQCRALLQNNGAITWAEPNYIFNDILEADNQHQLTQTLNTTFNHPEINMKWEMEDYEIKTKTDTKNETETWTLIKAWK